MNRKSFILHIDSLSILDKLSDEQAGKLFKAIRDYNTGIIPELDFALDLAFTNFKNQFDRDCDKWQEIKEKRIIAGAKGGKQKVANASKPKQKPPVSVNGSVSVSVNDSVNDNIVVVEDEHKIFADYLLSENGSLDKENLEVASRKFIDSNILKQFNSHLHAESKIHKTLPDYKRHLAGWLRKAPVNGEAPKKIRSQDDFWDYTQYLDYCKENNIKPEPQR